MKELTCDNEDLIFYLIIKEYNFSEEEIDRARFSLSINTANSIKKEKEKINIRKKSFDKKEKLECNIDWPICKYDQYFSNNDIIFFLVLQKKKKNFLKNYFIDKFNKGNFDNNKIDDKDLLIERKRHYCLEKKKLNENEEKEDKRIEIDNKEEEINSNNEEDYNNYNKIINKPEFIEASKNVINDLKNKLKNKKNEENKQFIQININNE